MGKMRILLIDDDELIRESCSDVLQYLGYMVTACESGREGVAFFREKRDEVDLVLIDMVMPVMGGKETLLALREIDPCVKAIFSSGYSSLSQKTVREDLGVEIMLEKPFDRDTLDKAIKSMLQHSSF